MITLRGLTQRYGDTTVVHDLSFEIAAGRLRRTDDHELVISGTTLGRIGDLAHATGARLHELGPQQASLEQAYMELTGESVEYASETETAVP